MDNENTPLDILKGLAADVYGRLFLLPKLKDPEVLRRFAEVSGDYAGVLRRLLDVPPAAGVNPEYQWDSWSEGVRRTFEKGVPLDFLSMPILRHPMVLGRRCGKRPADPRIKMIREVFGDEISHCLLLEDYPGAPAITDGDWLTSANRANQAAHLAYYRRKTGFNLWDSGSVLEWGGGYGNMARLARRMNPSLTYVIVDLPELLALQYIYLYGLEGGEALNIVSSSRGVAAGKINFVPSSYSISGNVGLRCKTFISTWAVTESPVEAQEAVIRSGFFSAEKVLLAYSRKDENVFQPRAGELGLSEDEVIFLPGHAYA